MHSTYGVKVKESHLETEVKEERSSATSLTSLIAGSVCDIVSNRRCLCFVSIT